MALVGLFGFDSRPHTTHDGCVYGKEIMDIINYEVTRRGEFYSLVVVYPDGQRFEDAVRHGEISEADVRTIHDIEFEHDPHAFGRVDFFTE